MKDKLKAITTLNRIKGLALDSASSELRSAQERLSAVDDEINELERRRVVEGQIEIAEAIPYLGHFLNGVSLQKSSLTKKRMKLIDEVELRKNDVFSAWTETKTTELLKDQKIHEILASERKSESDQFDERTISTFKRPPNRLDRS